MNKYKDKTTIVLLICAISSLVLALAGCQGAASADSQVPSQTAESSPALTPTFTPLPLATPYAQQPAAGICGETPEAEIIEVQIWPDIPSPRCMRMLPNQRLRVANRTQETIAWQLGLYDGEIQPGGEETLPMPLGSFLAPGVHRLLTSPYSGPEIWVIEE